MSEPPLGHGGGPPSWWPMLRWAVLALSILTLVVFAVEGTRPSPYADLQQALRQGEVNQVRVDGGFGGGEGSYLGFRA